LRALSGFGVSPPFGTALPWRITAWSPASAFSLVDLLPPSAPANLASSHCFFLDSAKISAIFCSIDIYVLLTG